MKPGKNNEGKGAARSTASAAPSPDELNQLVALYQARRYAELESKALVLVGRFPASGFVWKLLGAAQQMQGKNALEAFKKTAALLPTEADAHFNLGVAQKSLGMFNEAAASYRRALKLNSKYAEAYDNLGNVLKELGQSGEAIECFNKALAIKPASVTTLNNLGSALKETGKLDEAMDCYRRAIALNPKFADAHYNLGNALLEYSRPADAAKSFRTSVTLKPEFPDAWMNLGTALKENSQLDEAVACYRQVIMINPGSSQAHNNLGTTLRDQWQFGQAETNYRQAIALDPEYADANYNLGNLLRDTGQLHDAVACYHRALEIRPDFPGALGNLGSVLKDLGQLENAIVFFRRALELKPDDVSSRSGLLFALNYSARYTPQYCLDEARQYGHIVSEMADSKFTDWHCSTPPKKLTVGIVSGDLRNHPVGYFLESLLAHIDPARIELVAYAANHTMDALTERIKPCFSAWKELSAFNDEASARMIHNDGVHVLLDLSGHTRYNRLPVFAWKPAPVQVSWLGYFATTGVAEMDYLIADHVGVPESHCDQFTETVWYLPDTRLCFSPPEIDLPVSPLPAIENGHITFGCFQNMAKVEDDVLLTWAAILTAVPNARLRWQCPQFKDTGVLEQVAERLRQQGIDTARVSLIAPGTREEYLAAHAEVDLMLDTFPYPGGTTTCEALWMGVPTLTLAGDTLLARQGVSLLTAAGLADWVAASKENYVDKAVALAGDLPGLVELRAGLRDRVRSAPLFDAPRFAKNFELALWDMWHARTNN